MQARNNIFDKQNFTNIDGALKNITHNITDSNLILPFLQNVLRRFKIDHALVFRAVCRYYRVRVPCDAEITILRHSRSRK